MTAQRVMLLASLLLASADATIVNACGTSEKSNGSTVGYRIAELPERSPTKPFRLSLDETSPAQTATIRPISHATASVSTVPELEAKIAELAAEVDCLKAVPIYSTAPSPFIESAISASPSCTPVCTGPTWLAGLDVVFLRARMSGIGPAFNLAPSSGRLIEADHHAALRYFLEYRPTSSMGIRGRYFRYQHDTPFMAPFQPAQLGIALDIAETELVFYESFRNWDLSLSGGLQYGNLEYTTHLAGATGVGSLQFEGVGPVFAVDASHEFGDSGLSVFANARGSFLMGDIRNAAVLVNVPAAKIHDELMQIYQNQLGIAWSTTVNQRVNLKVKAAWETQFWVNDTLADDVYGLGTNLTMTGPAVALELSY